MPQFKTRFSIQEAGQACALHPSVLRIWEIRYGWPKPQRRQNGYRSYDMQQIEELKQVARLVRSGRSISSLVHDGQPHLLHLLPPPHDPYARLDALPRPDRPEARLIHRDLVQALRHQRYGSARGIIERAHWSLHPHHLLEACYLPTLVTLAEVQSLPASSPAQDAESQHLLREIIAARCRELNRRFRPAGPCLTVQPLTEVDATLAEVTALSLNLSGRAAQVCRVDQFAGRRGRHITASDLLSPMPVRVGLGHVSALKSERFWSLDRIPQRISPLPARFTWASGPVRNRDQSSCTKSVMENGRRVMFEPLGSERRLA